MKNEELKKIALEVRKDILEMVYKAGSGHPGGSLSAVELLVALYFNGHDKQSLDGGDGKFFLSNGHICPAWYSVLIEKDLIPRSSLSTYSDLGSILQGHPERIRLPDLVLNTSGPLGLGLAQAAGYAAIKKSERVYCMLSDAEHNEGNTWEAIMFANKYKLSNLVAIVDKNDIQIEGTTEEIMPLGDLRLKYETWGWNAVEINGHDFDEITNAIENIELSNSNSNLKPSVIIADTIFGKGVSFMEGNPDWHARAPSAKEYALSLTELNAEN